VTPFGIADFAHVQLGASGTTVPSFFLAGTATTLNVPGRRRPRASRQRSPATAGDGYEWLGCGTGRMSVGAVPRFHLHRHRLGMA
jgi:hypothetical protein